MNPMQRTWLRNVQSTLNDAHMIVTDCVGVNEARELTPDEIVLLDRIDTAIMFVQSMRTMDNAHTSHTLRVRPT